MRTRPNRRSHRRQLTAAVAALAAVMLAACGQPVGGGSNSGDAPAAAPIAGDEVRVVDNAFEPDHLEVAVGTEVTWVWEGDIPHDVVGDDFDSGIQREGTFSHAFEETGTFEYVCTLHRGMTGTVTVVDP